MLICVRRMRDERLLVHGRDVLAVEQHLPAGRLDQAVEHAHQGRLARPREAHDDEYLALANREIRIPHADGGAGAREDLVLGKAFLQEPHGFIGVRAEDLVEV